MKKFIYITFCLSFLLTQTSLIFTNLFLESVSAYEKDGKVVIDVNLNTNYELKSFSIERKNNTEDFSRIYFLETNRLADYSNIIFDNVKAEDDCIYRIIVVDSNDKIYTSTEFKINDKTDLSKIWDSIKSLFR